MNSLKIKKKIVKGVKRMNEQMNQISMEIILHAGDARKLVMDAFEKMGNKEFDEVRELLKLAKIEILAAHKAQTETIQAEASGTQHEFSLLFSHAQDTLMTISSEWNIANQLVSVVEKLTEK